MNTKCSSNRMITVGVALSSLVAIGYSMETSRFTVDSGGVIRSEGGRFELSGSIGQPVAGSLTGDSFTLSGGFWFPVPTGDGNDDGLVSELDHEALAACMTGPSARKLDDECRSYDWNRDGTVSLDDFSKLQAHFTGG